jgi:magnesium transporter
MITVVAFDFATKQEHTIPTAAAPQACADGRFCWIDVDTASDPAAASAVLRALGIDAPVVEAALRGDGEDRYDIHDDCLHLGLSAVKFEGGRFQVIPVDLVLGEHFLVTIRRGEVEFLNQVRRTYRQDFLKFARGPGFLLYECWDHLIDGYRTADRGFAVHVRSIQEQIFGDVDDEIFSRVAEVTRDLLGFRQIVLASREVLNELCTRRSAFVAETTQPYLEKMVGTLGRLDADPRRDAEPLHGDREPSHRQGPQPSHRREPRLPAAVVPLRCLRDEFRHHPRAAVALRISLLLGHRPAAHDGDAGLHEEAEAAVSAGPEGR